MSPAYIERLDLKAQRINVRAQKIDGSDLETFGMVIADFKTEDRAAGLNSFKKHF